MPGGADALDEHMGVCRETLTVWMREAARRKRNEREELARERAEMLREVEALRAGVTTDRAALEATLTMLQGQAKAQETRVLLEVGGVRFTTSVATLRTVPDSYFDAMFGGRFSAAGEDGLDSYEDETVSVERYTPETDTWSVVADMPVSKRSHGVCAVGTDMYVVGGRCGIQHIGGSNFLKLNSG